MGLLSAEIQHCKRCGGTLEGGEEICPHCSFHPRNEGLRYAGGFLLGVIILFTVVVLTGRIWPRLAAIGMIGVFVFFALAAIVFFISFLATPYRLGALFA